MAIHLIRSKASVGQMTDMMKSLESYEKMAADVYKKIIVGGGTLHADCESVLLED